MSDVLTDKVDRLLATDNADIALDDALGLLIEVRAVLEDATVHAQTRPDTSECVVSHHIRDRSDTTQGDNCAHSWLPWLKITDRSWVTRCVVCDQMEQWDT